MGDATSINRCCPPCSAPHAVAPILTLRDSCPDIAIALMAPRDANWIDVRTPDIDIRHFSNLFVFHTGPSRHRLLHSRVRTLVHGIRTVATFSRPRSEDSAALIPTTVFPSGRRRTIRRSALLPHHRICELIRANQPFACWECRRRLQWHRTKCPCAIRPTDPPHHDCNSSDLVSGECERISHDQTCRFDVDSPGLAPPRARLVGGSQLIVQSRSGNMDNWLG